VTSGDWDWLIRDLTDDAVVLCERAVELDPDSTSARRNLAIALHNSGRLEEAVVVYREHLARVPTDAAAHHQLAIAFEGLGCLHEAELEVRAAVALEDDAAALTDLGLLLFARAAYAEAERYLARATALADPDELWAAAYYLARTHAERGETVRAIAELEQLRERMPKLRVVADSLAELYRATGLPEKL
jgi:tetratricopeptide (TPR) repeat protein